MRKLITDRDVILGALLLAVAAIVVEQALGYKLGTTRQMGPGYFPLLLGGLLALLSFVILLRGLWQRKGDLESVATRPIVFVLGGVLLFGLLLRPFGLVAAIVAMVLIGAFASRSLGWRQAALLAGALAVASSIVFVGLLGQAMPIAGHVLRKLAGG